MPETSWQQAVAAYQSARSATLDDLYARRREFLKQVGIDRHSWATHRLRPQDGLSEDAWWVAVRSAMQSKKNCGTRMLGKQPIPKGEKHASSVRAGSE